MDPRRNQEQIGLFPATTPAAGAAEIDAIRAQAIQARDAAVAGLVRRTLLGAGQVLAAVGAALVTWPGRRATYEDLRRLSDRELSDIGLTRGDISRVFEPGFRVPGRAANANTAPAGRTQAA